MAMAAKVRQTDNKKAKNKAKPLRKTMLKMEKQKSQLRCFGNSIGQHQQSKSRCSTQDE